MAKNVQVRAWGSLADFLPDQPIEDRHERVISANFSYDYRQLAKDAVESVGVPHPEVDLLLVNGESSSFTRELQDGDAVDVYPLGHPAAAAHVSKVRVPLPEGWRFLVDENLGKLAGFLLILGFDTSIDSAWDDAELAARSFRESRILLTRDIGLLKRSIVQHGYWIRSDQPKKQIAEVIRRYDLRKKGDPLTRCLGCNVPLQSLAKEKAAERVPPQTLEAFDEFFHCPSCEKAYWKGSHYDRMTAWIEELEREISP